MTSTGAVLAFDIGGSKTHAMRVEHDGGTTEVGTIEVVVGSANVSSVGDVEAGRQLDAAIEQLGGVRGVAAVCAGAAGVDTPIAVRRLRELIVERVGCVKVRIVHDSQLILAAAGVDDGIAVISGTGSVAWARNGERTARAGGWGYLLGDEGSGYWVARESVRTTLDAVDKGSPAGELGQMLAADCGLADHTELLNHFYQQSDRRYWAGRSRVVFELARSGDLTCLGIVDAAARALASLAVQVCSRVEATGPVVLAGGLIVHQPMLAERVRRHLDGHHHTDVRILDVDPVHGAVRLAQELANHHTKADHP